MASTAPTASRSSAESVTARSSDAASGKTRRLARLLALDDGCPRAVAVGAHGQRVAAIRGRRREHELRWTRVPAAPGEAPLDSLCVRRDPHPDERAMSHVARLRELDEAEQDGERAGRGLVARQILRG